MRGRKKVGWKELIRGGQDKTRRMRAIDYENKEGRKKS